MTSGAGNDALPADVLAIAAHRDDVEQTCGGTLASHGRSWPSHGNSRSDTRRVWNQGHRRRSRTRSRRGGAVARGKLASSPRPARRRNRKYPGDRRKIVRVLRQVRPRVVILPYWQARHPDHAIVATLGYEACFLSGLAKVETGAPPHRPFKIIYASLYADVRPSFIVDITTFIDQRHQALMAYKSQYANQQTGSALFVPEEEIRERTFAEARHYGLLAGVRYGEPFVQKEVGLVDDLTLLPVQSI